ncbi:hypothetical protein RHMOL_Rhmol10G0259400 [Rhododendron molle]|uniref:Uncharacterized protein n=1 Tax=Rhododendron molle TaxID=49168 RepID=A0ACC0M682_RHOML|nr:hypothetical protein RHMOL_Rhmol10G0259400 [Rhododendron molle]
MATSTSNIPTSFPSPNAQVRLITAFILFLLPIASSDYFQVTNFSPATPDIVYQGDAVTLAGAVEFNSLTYLCHVGWATYAERVQLWDSKTGTLSDFTTNFSFIIDTLESSKYGHGLAFFLAPVGFQIPPNSDGGFLGLFNTTTSNSAENKMVTVEFDSYPNDEWDPAYEHIGINNNSIGSVITTPWNASLYSGETCTASITYNASTKNLSVFWSYGGNSTSQGNSSLSYKIDLMQILPEWVIVGFSAATGEYLEKHTLESWAFSSSFNTNTARGKHTKDIKLIVGLTVSTGTLGYLAPEYIRTGKASKEADVYSFGVVVLEIASGRKSVNPTDGQSEIGLVEWVWDLYGRGQILSAIDERLKSNFDAKQVECLMIVGLWCAYPDHSLRPSIRHAIQVLHLEAAMPHLPMKMPVPMYHVPGAGTSRTRPEEPLIHSGEEMISSSIEMGR